MNFELVMLFLVCGLAAWSLYENSSLRDRCRELEGELTRVSRRTAARHQVRAAASVKGWRTRKQRKAQEVQHVAG